MNAPSRQHRGPTPWYRQFWPWFLIALPASAVVASLFTIWLAVSSPNSMVVDDYSRIALTTQQRMERDARAAELGISAALRVVPDAGVIRVRLAPASVYPEGLSLRMSHPTMESQDRRLELAPSPEGWTGRTEPFEGRWYVQIEPKGGDWRLAGVIDGGGELELRPPASP
ncbi:MAG: FixH family protein [Gammaproteobacteria bacterium]